MPADFVEGFERGFALRSQVHQMADYGCQVHDYDTGYVKRVVEMIQQARVWITAAVQTEAVDDFLEALEIFLQEGGVLAKTLSDETYGEFCRGMFFGAKGGKMLEHIAHQVHVR